MAVMTIVPPKNAYLPGDSPVTKNTQIGLRKGSKLGINIASTVETYLIDVVYKI